MAEPPSYEESTLGANIPLERKGDQKSSQPWSIREQVGLSRTQHVASIVSQIVDHVRERALQGLSRTTLVLIPSDQDASRKGVVVGFPDDDDPTMIQFEGRQNGTQFWTQDEALRELEVQLQNAISEGAPAQTMRRHTGHTTNLPPPPPPRKTSWFGRKASKMPESVQEMQCAASPDVVDVRLDELHFRSETEYGLYETLRARVVLATVDVR